ncbi:hypothetical protein J3F83DRAFT_732597 [Trichoderma novae-zelandiae]
MRRIISAGPEGGWVSLRSRSVASNWLATYLLIVTVLLPPISGSLPALSGRTTARAAIWHERRFLSKLLSSLFLYFLRVLLEGRLSSPVVVGLMWWSCGALFGRGGLVDGRLLGGRTTFLCPSLSPPPSPPPLSSPFFISFRSSVSGGVVGVDGGLEAEGGDAWLVSVSWQGPMDG